MLNNLQNLRALAAYSVVLFHCLIGILHPTDPVGRGYLDLPSGGVDLFFVISGFVMVHTTRDDELPAWFAAKRIARIVPLYWFATFLVIATVTARSWTFPNALITPDAILASLFFVPHVDAGGHAYPILFVGWTLNHEMMFYALFALSLALPRTFRLPGILVLITLVWGVANAAGSGVVARFYAEPIIFEFAAGCIIATALRQKAVADLVRKTPMWPLAMLSVAGFAALPAFISVEQSTLLRYGGPAMLLVFAAAGQDLYRKPARETFVTGLGDASYSAYLLHPIVIIFATTVSTMAIGEGPVAETIIVIGTLSLTAIISKLSLKYFERPTASLARSLIGNLRGNRTAVG